MEFYSEPSSPKQCVSPFGQPRANSTIDEFEFETSRRFDLNDIDFQQVNRMEEQNKQEIQSEEDSSHAMAFADELFSDGKVLPLLPRLKLPPGLECGSDNHRGKSSTTSSPRSPGSAFKIKFVHQNLWNDDFDPFLVALQSVKDDGRGKTQATHAWAQSLYTRRPNNTSDQNMGPQLPLHQQSEAPMNSQQAQSTNGPTESPNILKEPKGLAFVRAVAKMDYRTRSRPKMSTVSGPILKTSENRRDGGGSYTMKRNKLMKLLALLGKFSLKSVRSAQPHER